MPSFRQGVVTRILSERPGLQRVLVDIGGNGGAPAFVLTELIGPVAVGHDVIVNTTAVELGLGTGGWHIVHWDLARRDLEQPGPGHIMKLRYSSLQTDTGGAEEQHPDLPPTLDGTPVVACSVHSQIAGVAISFKHQAPRARLSYVMTDGGALPMALSDLIVALREESLIDATVSAGHAFGGDLEAVSTASALTLARHVQHADAVVVGMGPGVVGTGTDLGTTATEVASVLDLVDALDGHPILAVRDSDADPRERHRGVSHHAETILRLAHAPVLVADTGRVGPAGPHDAIAVEAPDTVALLADRGIEVTTMGRTPGEDPEFFTAAGAAGALAAQRLARQRPERGS